MRRCARAWRNSWTRFSNQALDLARQLPGFAANLTAARQRLEYHPRVTANTDLPLSGLRACAARLGREAANVRLIVLFGSMARGRALASSDVDIGILGAEFWQALHIGAELARLCAREPHVVELDHAPELLRYEIARDGIALYEREPDAWARFRAEAIVRYLDFKPTLDLCVAGARRRLLAQARHG